MSATAICRSLFLLQNHLHGFQLPDQRPSLQQLAGGGGVVAHSLGSAAPHRPKAEPKDVEVLT